MRIAAWRAGWRCDAAPVVLRVVSGYDADRAPEFREGRLAMTKATLAPCLMAALAASPIPSARRAAGGGGTCAEGGAQAGPERRVERGHALPAVLRGLPRPLRPGNGPLASDLRVPVPDLTTVAARNGGKFPAERVQKIIARRREPARPRVGRHAGLGRRVQEDDRA